jgi:transposase
LRKIGEDVTETLELIPRQWKVIQHVREKFSCRACECISQPPAPSHPIAGAAAATLMPLVDVIRSHVFGADRIHADDTTVPVLAKGKTRIGGLWTYVRDDRPFGGPASPAAVFFYSRDRGGEHPEQHLVGYAGMMQADAYAGFSSTAVRTGPSPVPMRAAVAPLR